MNTHPHTHNRKTTQKQDAVFATVMRDPTDRWYSQYRFEHVEHRDGGSKTMPFDKWCVVRLMDGWLHVCVRACD
jgi:hypothetical protein